MGHVFDSVATEYDQWYETPAGSSIFRAEVDCLRGLCDQCHGRWLEVGVGTGRFASAMGIGEGVDVSPRMLEIAAGRGIRTHLGRAESLPFTNGSFDGILMALTLCFVTSAHEALRECWRVLGPEGAMILGIVPSDSHWGQAYQEQAAEGHPIYSHAHFRTAGAVVHLAQDAGFALTTAASTLFWKPDDVAEAEPRVEAGIAPGAGFVVLLCRRTQLPCPSVPCGASE